MLDEREQERFMQLWTGAQPAVSNYIRAVVRDASAAKDVLQETALVLFRKFAEYDGQRPFLGWALGVARFQVLGFHRDAARSFLTFDPELFERFTEQWTASAPTADARAGALQACLARLASRARQVVRMRYFEELTAVEIAERTESSGAAVRVMLQRIREQLRECIARQMDVERSAT
ncbi:MAG: sigma-70 family RNA polymerase sigma factor [Chthoniobacteraceae bacterium]